MKQTITAAAVAKVTKWSKNAKTNAVLSEIADDLLNICDTESESLEGIRRYMREFPREIDYNLAQYGNMLVYYGQVREMYKRAGYKSVDRLSDTDLWETYRRQVGYIARAIVKNC